MNNWPKDLTIWDDPHYQCMSVPFTWLLPKAQRYIDAFRSRSWLVGGPAVALMPDYLQRCEIGREYPGVLQRVNPLATRTTVGCPRSCLFCGVRKICGEFRELDHWPNLPIVCDDNLLAASDGHVERVLHGLIELGQADFNQGLDCRLLKPWHAEMIAQIERPMVRLALDSNAQREPWVRAYGMLRDAGIAKSRIRCYVLVGDDTLEADWARCRFVESHGVKALSMWCHTLTAMTYGEVTLPQIANGWSKERQRQIMRWHYKHAGKPLR
jgi:hypothetical protein